MSSWAILDLVSLDTLSLITRTSGTLSLFTWLFAQLPQVLENHLNKLVEGVSLLFLLLWASGDASNLAGCLLTGALPFQTLLAAYYCFIDCILGLQYWYYTRVFPRQRNPIDLLQSPKIQRLPLPKAKIPRCAPAGARRNRFEGPVKSKALVACVAAALTVRDTNASSLISHLQLDDGVTSFLFSSATWGKAFAWTCSVLYLSSRAPQILKNYRNQSTRGVTVYLFLCAMIGNIFYSISVITDLWILNETDEQIFDSVFFVQLPFLVGSIGTVCFDFILIIQCWKYAPLDEGLYCCTPLPQRANSRKAYCESINSLALGDEFSTEQSQREHAPPISEFSSLLKNPVVPEPFENEFGSYSATRNAWKAASGSAAPEPDYASFHARRSSSFLSIYGVKGDRKVKAQDTSLIPELVGSYISISRKMMSEEKSPFSPSDFLSTEFAGRPI